MILQYRSILNARLATSFLFTYEDDGDMVMRLAFAVSEKAFVYIQTCRGRSVAGVFGGSLSY